MAGIGLNILIQTTTLTKEMGQATQNTFLVRLETLWHELEPQKN